jgi:alpha-L-rhamnosidase
LSDKTLEPPSIYFRYYVYQAAIQAGLGDQALTWLDDWRICSTKA